jgi:RNA polymerase sigma-70 factor (ECF subfamily)
MNAIQALAEADRAAFLLRVQHELPYQEIARILQLPLTTVKVKIHRARLKLAAHQIGEKP